MPICPKCHEEYESGMTQCYDCAVPLVDSLDEVPSAGEGPGKVVFSAATEEELEQMKACLDQWQIPYTLAADEPHVDIEGHGLVVPPQYGDKAAQMLLATQQLSAQREQGQKRGSCSTSGCSTHDPAIEESELLRRPLGELARMGAAVRDELIEHVVGGSPSVQRRAALALSYMGPPGIDAIVKLMKVGLEKEEVDTVTVLLTVLRQTECVVEEWREFLAYLGEGEAVRIKALEVIGHLGDLDAFDHVLPLLSDPVPAVRDEADNTLCLLSDEDMGFDSEASAEEQKNCIELWRKWWEMNSL